MELVLSNIDDMGKKTTKAEKMFHISACILVLDIRKGHLSWKVTELVKKSGISRALIYRYFGSNKEKMLKIALKLFVEHFYGFEEKTLSFSEVVGNARRYIINYPDAALFYQKVRMGNSELSRYFQEVEIRFRKKLAKEFPMFSEHQILIMHACIHGMVTAPFLTVDESVKICRSLLKLDRFPQ
jgi:AcrR family transcriptional regulator